MGQVVYPSGLAQSGWFDHYATLFDTVEINNTFYGMPAAETFAAWRRRAPAGFLYAVKSSGFATHRKKLKDPDMWLDYFLDRARLLGETLGPVLVQLPPNWRPNPGRLAEFARRAPGDIRWALEVRDSRWLVDEVLDVVRQHGWCLVRHDLLAEQPDLPAPGWAYLRFHGPDPSRPYVGSYQPAALRRVATEIRAHLAAGRDVYAYFDNDYGGRAVGDARALRELVTGR